MGFKKRGSSVIFVSNGVSEEVNSPIGVGNL